HGRNDDDGDGRDLDRRRLLAEELAQHELHSGMFPCFFLGMAARLPRSVSKARMTRRRVPCGMITSSMKPRSAATKGLAKRASYSAVRWRSLSGSPSSAR